MSLSANPRDDVELVERALEGENDAIRELRDQYNGQLKARLLRRGASETDAEEILTDLWSDCVMGKFQRWQPQKGSSLIAWLSSVATNRLIDHFRRRRFQVEAPDSGDEDGRGRSLDELGATVGAAPRDTELARLLQQALRRALGDCDSTGLLMLKLVHLHGLTGREVARMWGWHESKVSRCASRAEEEIRERTLAEVRRREPTLELTWEDLMELCANCRGSLFGAP